MACALMHFGIGSQVDIFMLVFYYCKMEVNEGIIHTNWGLNTRKITPKVFKHLQ